MQLAVFDEKQRKQIYDDAIVLLYRLLFLGYAEARNWAEARMKEAIAEGYIVAFPERKTTKKQPNPPTWNRKE